MLKARFDRVTVKEHMIRRLASEGLLTGKHTIVVTAGGGAYGPGTPREHYDFKVPYLRALLEQIGLDRNLEFAHAEMTLAHSVAALEQFKPIADASREEAVKNVRKLVLAGRRRVLREPTRAGGQSGLELSTERLPRRVHRGLIRKVVLDSFTRVGRSGRQPSSSLASSASMFALATSTGPSGPVRIAT